MPLLTNPAFWVLMGAVIVGVGAVLESRLGRWHKGVVVVGALLSAGAGFWSDREQGQLNDQLAKKTQQIEELNSKIAKQADFIAGSVTGGDSFCYLDVVKERADNPFFVLVHKGEYPLFDVEARIVDRDSFARRMRDGKPSSTLQFFQDPGLVGKSVQLGTVVADQARPLGPLLTIGGDTARLNIFFTARNGTFTENLHLRKVGGNWVAAKRVFRRGAPEDPVFEQIAPEYPRSAAGQVDWE